MNHSERLRRLGQIADLLRDRDLSRLSEAQAAKARTEGLLTALDQTTGATGLATAMAAIVEENHGLWAMQRRMELNRQLAREMAVCLQAQDAARTAFGRAQVLRELSKNGFNILIYKK